MARLTFSERYEDLGLLACGGWGQVRRVWDSKMQREIVAKVLAGEHLGSDGPRVRFQNEARVTAALDHPGVVPIYDSGELPDGRPWFAMKRVTGRTLSDLLAERGTVSAIGLRRRVEILMRIGEVVGHAHERGVVHRDLKPSNVMVGHAGEVLVLDWGIARVLRQDEDGPVARPYPEVAVSSGTLAGAVLGTMAYMAPEQARGERVGPSADVYAGGMILFEILHGRRARTGSAAGIWAQAARGDTPPITEGPEELRSVCTRALARLPSDRYGSGSDFAASLRRWLEGAERAVQAEHAVLQAAAIEPELENRREERESIHRQAHAAAADLRDHDPVSRKEVVWELEDRRDALDRVIARLEAQRMELLRLALQYEPTLISAHAALAATHRARLADSEARGDDTGAELEEVLLRQHDRGEHASFLRGLGRLELESAPSGVQVVAHRWVERGRRLRMELVGPLGATPLRTELPAGSYSLELLSDRGPVFYPVLIERDKTWPIGGRSGRGRVELTVHRDESECYVPGGFTWVGGDALAAEPIPLRRVWVDGFVIQRFPVTFGEYLQYLDDLVLRGDHGRALRDSPRLSRASSSDALLVAVDGGRHKVLPDEHGRDIPLDSPVVSIDWHSASSYAKWLAARSGRPWRLPNELEWEKAARGVDRRAYPWGAQPEPTWANVLGTSAEPPRPAIVDSYPTDTSPYGVRGMAGNVRDWCINTWQPTGPAISEDVVQVDAARDDDPEMRVIRGGAWTSVPAFARCAGRFAAKPDERFAVVGFRLVETYKPVATE